MKSHPIRFIILLLALLALLPFSAVSAAEGTDLSFVVGCDGFVAQGGAIVFETSQSVVIRAQDAAGTLLLEETLNRPADGEYNFSAAQSFSWATAPNFSPIVVSVTTTGDSILDRELVYLVVGSCPDLPRMANAFAIGIQLNLMPLLVALDGSTAPSVPINSVPPRPSSTSSEIQALQGYAVVDTDNLFLRTGPGVEYTVAGVLDGGTHLIVLGRNTADLEDDDSDLWWYVEVGGLRGWVNSAFLVLRGDLSNAPVVPAQGELIQPIVYVGFTGQPLYAEASTASSVVCTLVGNLFYPVLGRDSETANHYYVEATCEDGQVLEGWLPAEAVILRYEGFLGEIPIR